MDISKAFDKVWHEGIIFKLQQNGISDDLLNILSDFLRNRKQRVTLNGQSSSWTNVNAGVPKGSILGPLRFLIYIDDLPDALSSNAKLFADDTSLFSVVHEHIYYWVQQSPEKNQWLGLSMENDFQSRS